MINTLFFIQLMTYLYTDYEDCLLMIVLTEVSSLKIQFLDDIRLSMTDAYNFIFMIAAFYGKA